jgi:hypothetical protein
MNPPLSCEIPFSGFYNSEHDAAIDQVTDYLWEDLDDTLFQTFHKNVNWQRVNGLYARDYVKWLAEALNTTLEFEELQSLGDSNFTTDRIFAKVEYGFVFKMLSEVQGKKLDEVIGERFTNRPGFISHYPNNISEWPRLISEWDYNHLGTVMEAYMRDNELRDTDYAEYALEKDSSTGYLKDLILSCANDKAKKAFEEADYLPLREEPVTA